jgi:hypothetical protein
MNLHISHYPNRFILEFIKNEEQFYPTDNRYIVYNNDQDVHLKNNCLELAKENVDSLFETIGDFSKYKRIYIHFLNDLMVDFINSLNSEIKVIWVFWGDDGFSRIEGYKSDFCLGPRTKSYYDHHLKLKMKWCKNPVYLYKNYKEFKKTQEKAVSSRSAYVEATERIDFFAHNIYDDYLLIKEHSNLKASFIDYSYMTGEQCCGNIRKSIDRTKKNIIVGNSADYSNVHLDIFERLSKADLSEIENIYIPLSYSGGQKYVKTILKDAAVKFGDKTHAMTTLLPLDEYVKILGNASIGIIGTVRSQAEANIIALLMQGSRVYMDSGNASYKHYKSAGAIIFTIDADLENDLKNGNTAFLSKEETKHNNDFIEKMFGARTVAAKYMNLLNV